MFYFVRGGPGLKRHEMKRFCVSKRAGIEWSFRAGREQRSCGAMRVLFRPWGAKAYYGRVNPPADILLFIEPMSLIVMSEASILSEAFCKELMQDREPSS